MRQLFRKVHTLAWRAALRAVCLQGDHGCTEAGDGRRYGLQTEVVASIYLSLYLVTLCLSQSARAGVLMLTCA